MALKDLVADRGKLTEEAIEQIVGPFARYDPEDMSVIFTPEGGILSNERKILVYLVALQGWKFILKDHVPTDAKPAAIEPAVGIPGGTLRPLLKKLKDGHLLAAKDGAYFVRPSSIDAIGRFLGGEKSIGSRRTLKRRASEKAVEVDPSPAKDRISESIKQRRRGGIPIMSSICGLVDEGWFKDGRTLLDLIQRLHEMAIIAKRTSLSKPMAELVRKGVLQRRKSQHGNKEVWMYKVK